MVEVSKASGGLGSNQAHHHFHYLLVSQSGTASLGLGSAEGGSHLRREAAEPRRGRHGRRGARESWLLWQSATACSVHPDAAVPLEGKKQRRGSVGEASSSAGPQVPPSHPVGMVSGREHSSCSRRSS